MTTAEQYVAFYTNRYDNQNQGGALSTVRIQKGAGLGDFFANAFRKFFPYLKNGAKAVGGQLLNTGIGLLRDTINGKNLRDSMRERVTSAGKDLTERAATSLGNMVGSGLKGPKRLARRQSKTRAQRKNIKARHMRDIFS